MNMKKLILAIILMIVHPKSHCQNILPQIIFEINNGNIRVNIWNDAFDEKQITLEVVCRSRLRHHNFLSKRFGMASIYLDMDYRENTNSMFQNLYYWTKELECFAVNNKKEGETKDIIMRRGTATLMVHKSQIHIYYMHTDNEPRSTMKLKDITEFKKRLLEYTSSRNIDLRL